MNKAPSLLYPVNHVTLGPLQDTITAGTKQACAAIAAEIDNMAERGPVTAAIDGGIGTPFTILANEIIKHLPGEQVSIIDMRQALKNTPALPAPAAQLRSLFNPEGLAAIQGELQNPGTLVTLLIGPGAALSGLLEYCNLIIYADESRPASREILHLSSTAMPALDAHKRQVLSFISGYLAWSPEQETVYLPRRAYEALTARLGVAPMMFNDLKQGVTHETCLRMDWGGEIMLDLPFQNVLWHATIPILGDMAARITRGQLPPINLEESNIGGTQEVLRQGEGWQEIHLGRHANGLLLISRLAFDREIGDRTEPEDSFHALQTAAHQPVEITANDTGQTVILEYPHTALLPASLHGYTLRSMDSQPCKVLKAVVSK